MWEEEMCQEELRHELSQEIEDIEVGGRTGSHDKVLMIGQEVATARRCKR